MSILHRALRTLAITIGIPLCSAAAQQTEVRGHVTDRAGPVPGADVIVIIVPSADNVTTKTDSSGAYAIRVTGGTEYMLNVSALGRAPFRRRLTRTSSDTVLTVDVVLVPRTSTLAAVKVQASRPRPQRSLGSDPGAPGTDGTDKTVDGSRHALSPELQGNLDAMATQVPGLAVTNAGISALGLGPENNRTTLNGLPGPDLDLPREVQSTTRFMSSPWDPSYGGFAGVLASRTLLPGTNVRTQRARFSADAVSVQADALNGGRVGQPASTAVFGFGGAGPLQFDNYFYNYGLQIKRSATTVASIVDLDPRALASSGVAPDSAVRLLQILSNHGNLIGSFAGATATTSATFVDRIDHRPPAPADGAVPNAQWSLTALGGYTRADAGSVNARTTPGVGGNRLDLTGGLQASLSSNFGASGQIVNEANAGVNIASSRTRPRESVPAGMVFVTSDLGDTNASTSALSFGGNSALALATQTVTAQAGNQTAFFLGGRPSLPLKLSLQTRFDGYRQTPGANQLGAFTFASLEDLAADNPSSFSRTLSATDRHAGAWSGAAALGGDWIFNSVTLTGGLRADANVFATRPAYNPAVESTFGVRNDRVPNSVDLSPRLGFNWYYTTRAMGYSILSGPTTTNRGRARIRGGVGKFRGLVSPYSVSDAVAATGLPGSAVRLSCVGAATPLPDWGAYQNDPATIPASCAAGAGGSADAASSVIAFNKGYNAPETWRASLGWTSLFAGTYIAIDGLYALTSNLSSTTDLNFSGVQRFALAQEGGRPVFARVEDVDAASGMISPAASRISSAFGRVGMRSSDLKSSARQLTVYMIPDMPVTMGIVSLAYTYSDVSSEGRGFDRTVGMDPRLVERAPSGYTPKHQFIVQAGTGFSDPLNMSFTGMLRVSSGLPYTPMVGGDINGDGYANDRAFVFDPRSVSDAPTSRALQSLLDRGNSAAKCLARQMGTIAGQSSCRGPWTTSLNAGMFWAPTLPRFDDRLRMGLNLANPLSLADRIAHGSDHLRGWGSAFFPDQTLYQVRGFDPSSRRYTYAVNGNFGNNSPGLSWLRSPFRVTLDVTMELGRTRTEQLLAQNIVKRPGTQSERAPAEMIQRRYMQTGYQDIYGVLLRMSDSLALSHEQMLQVEARRAKISARADSLYSGLAAYLATLPADYNVGVAAERVKATTQAMWDMLYAEQPFLASVLTRGQLRLLPTALYHLATDPNYKGRFFF